jgi:hypothetical protein
MRIAIYTPMALASAIGRVNAIVADELIRRGIPVTLVRSEHPKDATRAGPIHPSTASVDDAAKYDANPGAFAAGFDAVFFSLGDEASFHYFAIKHGMIQPGIAILYDLNMTNALSGFCALEPETLNFREVMSIIHGDTVGQEIDAAHATRTFFQWYERAMVQYPTFEWALVRAHGCLAHSRDVAEAVRKSTGLIVAATPLPLVRHAEAVSSNFAATERVRLVGHINDNKRTQSVAAAIGTSRELCSRLEYHIVGPIDPTIRAQIEMVGGGVWGDAGFITFHGRVDDETLDAVMADAHIACCLSWPALEAGLPSCMEAMARGLPTVVPNTGVYADIPDECVIKIDLARETDHLRDVLLQLVRSPELRATLGAAGRAYVVRNHSTKRYADDLLRLTSQVLAARPALLVLDRMGSVIADLGVNPSCRVLARVAQVIESMFGGQGPIGEIGGKRGIS